MNKYSSLLEQLRNRAPCFWKNPNTVRFTKSVLPRLDLKPADLKDAKHRWEKYRPLFKALFADEQHKIAGWDGSVVSDVRSLDSKLNKALGLPKDLTLLMKMDSHLPVCGSIKARGGLFEVFKVVQSWAEESSIEFIPSKIEDIRQLMEKNDFEICVGSTGNLGMSVGLGARAFGCKATVDMSQDAKEWKKTLLRSKGVNVIEHKGDYGEAVERGRQQAFEKGDKCHFVCDETSRDLMMGYSCAAFELKKQLADIGRSPSIHHPLIVYIPCGVGGGPAGVAWGLKSVLGDHVHVIFAEPIESPCVLLGLMTGRHEKVTVRELGLTNRTEADGLAVARPSGLACRMANNLIYACYTLDDEDLFTNLKHLHRVAGIYIEPSCCISLSGPGLLLEAAKRDDTIDKEMIDRATHLLWATGGSLVPPEEVDLHLNVTRVTDKFKIAEPQL